jgi:hypothetical protein
MRLAELVDEMKKKKRYLISFKSYSEPKLGYRILTFQGMGEVPVSGLSVDSNAWDIKETYTLQEAQKEIKEGSESRGPEAKDWRAEDWEGVRNLLFSRVLTGG